MVDHLTSLLEKAEVVPAVNQIEVHPYFQQREVQAFGAEHGILTQAWSPIGGITFYRDGNHGSTLEDPVIGKIAEAHGKSPAQVMLRWHLQEGRSVIPKSTKPHRIAENFDVFDFDLTDDELAAIDALDTDQRGGPEPADITLESFGRDDPGSLIRRNEPDSEAMTDTGTGRRRHRRLLRHRRGNRPRPRGRRLPRRPARPPRSTASPRSPTSSTTAPSPSPPTSPTATASSPPPTASSRSSAAPTSWSTTPASCSSARSTPTSATTTGR